MKTNTYGTEIIKHFEGFSHTPYLCPAGYLTIGYGHLIKTGESFSEISKQEAESLLQKDLAVSENAVKKLIAAPLNENQFSSLVSFTFNLGSGALQASTLRAKINRGDFNIENEFLKWVFANGKKLKGLIKRRNLEAQLFFTI
jgi:lysozyme